MPATFPTTVDASMNPDVDETLGSQLMYVISLTVTLFIFEASMAFNWPVIWTPYELISNGHLEGSRWGVSRTATCEA